MDILYRLTFVLLITCLIIFVLSGGILLMYYNVEEDMIVGFNFFYVISCMKFLID